MSGQDKDQAEKSFEPTPEKLRQAREKGEVARSADLSVAAAYLGLLLALLTTGAGTIVAAGSALMPFLDSPDRLIHPEFLASAGVRLRDVIGLTAGATFGWFVAPAAAVILSVLAQRAFTFTPSKLAPRMSRISPLANAKQKFGRMGLFEFAKSFTKLFLFAICLALFLRANLSDIIALSGSDPALAVSQMGRLGLRFLGLAALVALAIGAIDAIWQHVEHRRRNRMTRQEVQDETKSSEGDPHLKQTRRQRGQEIARNQMLAEVPKSDVVIVNPTHYAVALKWSRMPGAAPVCVAKGVDETARRIRETAMAAGVPVHSDPPTARALHAAVRVGSEIDETHYRAVAAAIRFADEMRTKARERAF